MSEEMNSEIIDNGWDIPVEIGLARDGYTATVDFSSDQDAYFRSETLSGLMDDVALFLQKRGEDLIEFSRVMKERAGAIQ